MPDDVNWNSPYVPMPGQRRFHASPAKEKLYLAGVGAGKTICGVHEMVRLRSENKGCNGLIVAPTYPMLRDVILTTWQQWVHPSLYTIKASQNMIVWHGNGLDEKIFLRSATEPGRISGLTVSDAWIEEAGLLAKDEVWKIMQARVRDPRAQRRCLYATTTPGFMWLVSYFRKTGFVVRSRTRDNKYLPEDFEAGLRAAYGEEYAAAFLDALIIDLLGQVWPVSQKLHGAFTIEEARDRCKWFFGGGDFGHTAPAALIVGGVDGDGRWWLVDEWYKRGQNRDVIAAQARRLTDKWKIQQWYVDHDPEGVSQMQALNLNVVLAEKEVISGIQHFRGLIPPRLDGRPRVMVGSWLKSWWKEQASYRFPDGEEEPEAGDGDHIMDATRYMTYTNSRVWVGSEDYQSSKLIVPAGRIEREQRDWGAY